MSQFKTTIDKKIVAIVGVSLFIAVVSFAVVLHIRQNSRIDSEIKLKAEKIASTLQGSWQHNANIFLRSRLPLNDSTSGVLSMIHYKPLRGKDTLSRTGMEELVVQEAGQEYIIKQTSLNLRNPQNKPDQFEEAALRIFDEKVTEARRQGNANSISENSISIWEKTNIGSKSYYRYIQPIFIKNQCLACHGSKIDAPEYVQARYENGYGYRSGDLRGALSMIIPADDINAAKNETILVTYGGGFLVLLFVGLITFVFIRRTVTLPILKIVESTKRISEGNLSERVSFTASDDIASIVDSFNALVDSIKEAVRDIVDLTQRLNQIALDISNTATGISKTSDGQISTVRDSVQVLAKTGNSIETVLDDVQGLTINVRETRTSIEDLTSSVQEVSRSIQDANQVFNQVIHEVQGGKLGVEQITQSIYGIGEKLAGLATQIQTIEKSSREITNISDTAVRNAKQMNLMAVNATIESSIPESGKGFRVVAKEIRILAEQSVSYSLQVQDLVTNIRQNVGKVESEIMETNVTIQESAATVRDAEKTLDKITGFYSRSSSIMSRLSGLADAQMRSTQQITMKTSDMSMRTAQVMEQMQSQKITGQKVSKTVDGISNESLRVKNSANEITQLSQELINQAEQLQSAVQKFKLTESSQLFR
ncbi:MAG: methyl-accepting chemotaxis protein [Chloroherpetonaceae bacterium]|nr:methyl-accepting chemotaxis protein [Chloroherpetonaceae bacterium]